MQRCLATAKSLALHPSLNIHCPATAKSLALHYPATAKSLALHPSLNKSWALHPSLNIHYPATAKSLALHPSLDKSWALHPSLNIHCPATAKSLALHPSWYVRRIHYPGPPYDVFINHRGIDTKLNLSGLLFHQFSELNLRPFLDSKSMRPGEPLSKKINEAICGCKVGVAVFSPHYCESPHCLHELAMLRETKKRVIPIFCDVKPSQLQVVDDGNYSDMDLQRFRDALEETRDTVGLTFDTARGDWSKLLKDTSDAVIRNVIEVDQEVELSST